MLELDGVSKGFPGARALDDVSIACAPGEVLALVGENGAGKSTLIKILAGAYHPDSGTIRFAGTAFRGLSPAESRALGISVIHQEFNLVPEMSVLENMFLGSEIVRRSRRLDLAAMAKDAHGALDRLGAHVDLRATVGSLSVAQQQLVEIARALLGRSRLVVMDEPTAVLAGEELDRLLGIVGSLRDQGLAVIYVSHHLPEVFRVADRIAVLKDGTLMGTWPVAELDHDALVRQMIGRPVTSVFPPPRDAPAEVVLSVRDLSAGHKLAGVSFELRRGEVLGVGGLVGSGRTTLAHAVFGQIRHAGAVELGGRARPRLARAIAAGVCLVPEDRKEAGLVLGKTVRFNLGLPNLKLFSRLGMLRRTAERDLARTLAARVELPEQTLGRDVAVLSGGTQQKVVVGKWLARHPKVVILDEPTRGIDIGAKTEIYRQIRALTDDGVAVLLVSSDLLELIGMSDRILVLRDGRVAGELGRADASEDAVIRLATGVSAA